MSTPYVAVHDDDKDHKKDEDHAEARKNKIIYICIFTFLAFTIEYLVREPFTHFSEWIQEQLVFESKCDIGSLFLWFKYQGKTFIVLFVYNISNIYISLSLFFLDSFGIFINGVFKLFYDDPRPFWRNANLVPCGCATNYGTPSTTALDEFLVCIVVFRALIHRYQNVFWKIFVWIMFLGPQILAWTSRFIQNIHSLPQLFFGLAVGYIIQYIYFDILEVNMEDSEQLRKLMNGKSFIITCVITLLVWAIANGTHYYLFTDPDNSAYLENMSKYCDITVEFFMFGNESYQKASKAFLFLGCIVGAYIEYKMHFDSNYDKYAAYNMGKENWTQTDLWMVFIRMVLIIEINAHVVKYFKFGNIKRDSLLYLNMGRCLLKSFVSGLFYFWINKVVFGLFNLTNLKGLNAYFKKVHKSEEAQ